MAGQWWLPPHWLLRAPHRKGREEGRERSKRERRRGKYKEKRASRVHVEGPQSLVAGCGPRWHSSHATIPVMADSGHRHQEEERESEKMRENKKKERKWKEEEEEGMVSLGGWRRR